MQRFYQMLPHTDATRKIKGKEKKYITLYFMKTEYQVQKYD
uniref:Uncharacterized protein n=1 Tax=Rhizophora mucronata TaxID=61149 RepID=A0A2P2PHH1_RHIMU